MIDGSAAACEKQEPRRVEVPSMLLLAKGETAVLVGLELKERKVAQPQIRALGLVDALEVHKNGLLTRRQLGRHLDSAVLLAGSRILAVRAGAMAFATVE